MTEKLTDESPMPYGKHKDKRMDKVPAHYLIWLYDNDKASKPVREYIEENMDVLNHEIKKSS
jgi:uncharacterized protein (DUF3820 family)